MVRIIKLKNVSKDEDINLALKLMQKDYNATIISVQCYGPNNDSYLIVYDEKIKVDVNKIIDAITTVSLDE